MKNKKWLWITLGVLDIGLTVFFFVVHIMMLAGIVGKTEEEILALRQRGDMIGWLARPENNIAYLLGFVIPLFLILAANVVILVIYVKRQTKQAQLTVGDLTDEQKEALRKELLQDLEKK